MCPRGFHLCKRNVLVELKNSWKLKTKGTLQNIVIRSFHRVTLRWEEFKRGRTGSLKPASSAHQCKPGATRGHFGAVPPKWLHVCPKRGLCSEESSGLLKCKSRPKAPKLALIALEFASKNCFFVVFVDSHRISWNLGDEDLFFWSSL